VNIKITQNQKSKKSKQTCYKCAKLSSDDFVERRETRLSEYPVLFVAGAWATPPRCVKYDECQWSRPIFPAARMKAATAAAQTLRSEDTRGRISTPIFGFENRNRFSFIRKSESIFDVAFFSFFLSDHKLWAPPAAETKRGWLS